MGNRIHKISKHIPSIFQGRLDFDARRSSISLSIEHPWERYIRHVLSVALIVLVVGYLYFVSVSVLNVIARKDALSHIAKMEGVMGGLEQKYFKLSQGVTPNVGISMGFSPVENTDYVYLSGNLSANVPIQIDGGAVTIARNAI